MEPAALRFDVRFDLWYEVLSRALLLPPKSAYLSVEGDEVEVRMGWAFRARFPRAAVTRVAKLATPPISRGVHGWWGRWLVNGSGRGIVVLDLAPDQRAYVTGFPVRLRQLLISVNDPPGVAAALSQRDLC